MFRQEQNMGREAHPPARRLSRQGQNVGGRILRT